MIIDIDIDIAVAPVDIEILSGRVLTIDDITKLLTR